jgi:cytochrome c oxidase cbb3-type subunit 1
MKQQQELVYTDLVKAHMIMGLIDLLLVMIFGLTYSLTFLNIHIVDPYMSPVRLRFNHTNVAAYGFLANLITGALYWAVPRMTGHPVWNRAYGWLLWAALQVAGIGTVISLLFFGGTMLGGPELTRWIGPQSVEWSETPFIMDVPITLWLFVVIPQFLVPIIKASKEKPLYTGLWYITAGLIWTPLVYVLGNYPSVFFYPGAAGAALNGSFIHDLVGLYVTPMGWGLMYYFVPRVLQKPIWSHGLGLLGFWGLAFFYPAQGVHHYLWSPIPMFAQYAAVFATIAIEIVVTTVLVNFMMTLRGSYGAMKEDMPLRWFYVGMINYWITCFQCSIQVLLTTQKVIHFTDWVTGHAHLIMFGTFGFWLLGMYEHIVPRMYGLKYTYSRPLSEMAFWFMLIGIEVMFVDLGVAGIAEGFAWIAQVPFIDSVNLGKPFWWVRTASGIFIFIGYIAYFYNILKTMAVGRAYQASTKVATA